MDPQNSMVLKSGIWYTISNLILKCISLLTTPLFTRLLTKQQYGDYNNFISWQGIVIIFVTLNLEASLISAKFDYKDKFKQYIFSILTLSSVSTTVWLVLCNIFMAPLSAFMEINPLYINLMLIYCGFYVAINIYQISERYFYRYKTSVAIALGTAFGSTFLSLFLVYSLKDGLFGRILGGVMPTILVGLFLYLMIARSGKRIDFSAWKYALKVCLPYIPHLLSLTVLNSVDRVMITKICGSEYNALYSVAYSCGAMVTILMTSMNNAFSPWLGDKLHIKDYAAIRKVSKVYIAGFCYLAVGIMILAPEVLLVMGGQSYMDAKFVMPPVAMGCVCQFLYTMFVNVEQFEKKTIGMAFASAAAALLNLGLNAVFIPMFGYIAAAYTTLAGFLFLLVIHMLLVKKYGYGEVYNYKLVAAIVGTMMLITGGMNLLYTNMVLRIIAIVAYVLALGVVFKKCKDAGLIERFLKKK